MYDYFQSIFKECKIIPSQLSLILPTLRRITVNDNIFLSITFFKERICPLNRRSFLAQSIKTK